MRFWAWITWCPLIPGFVLAQTFDRGQNIVAAEYFIDSDPGEGNGVPITQGLFGFYNVDLEFNVNLNEGSVIYIRFKSSNGTWSAPRGFKYKKPVGNRGGRIVKAEYYINQDPGIGKATPIEVNVLGQLVPFTLNDLNDGDAVYVRIMDNFERWSAAAYRVYKKIPANRGAQLAAAEYFINEDPGIGKGTPLKLDAFGEATIEVDLEREDRLFIRYKDSFGRWSAPRWIKYTYDDIVGAEYRFLYKNETLSPIKEMELEPKDDATLAFFSAISKEVYNATQNIDTILVRLKTNDILGNWFKFKFDQIIVTGTKTAQNQFVPAAFELYQNYPNPFNPTTVIQYDVPKTSRVTIEIFNVLGQKVRTLVNQKQPAGRYRVTWDARNDNGELVTAGLYICRMKTKEFVKSLSLVLVK